MPAIIIRPPRTCGGCGGAITAKDERDMLSSGSLVLDAGDRPFHMQCFLASDCGATPIDPDKRLVLERRPLRAIRPRDAQTRRAIERLS